MDIGTTTLEEFYREATAFRGNEVTALLPDTAIPFGNFSLTSND